MCCFYETTKWIFRAKTCQTWIDLFSPPTQRAHCSDAAEEIHTAAIVSARRAPMTDDEVAFRSALQPTGNWTHNWKLTPWSCASTVLEVTSGVEPQRCCTVNLTSRHPRGVSGYIRERSGNVSVVSETSQTSCFCGFGAIECSSGGHIRWAGRPLLAGSLTCQCCIYYPALTSCRHDSLDIYGLYIKAVRDTGENDCS